MKHELKTWPDYWWPIRQGLKTFELRKDDRNYQVGDTLILRNYDPKSGQFSLNDPITASVDYIVRGPTFGLEAGFCVMAITVIQSTKPTHEH